MCISARDDNLSWPMQISSWLAIIYKAAKKLPVFPRLSPFKTLLSPRRGMRPQKRVASKTHLTMCLFLIIFFLFSSCNRLFTFCSVCFNRIKEGLGGDHCVVMVFYLLMSFCLLLKLTPVYERLVNKSSLIFPAMHRYHQSTMFTEYSIY